MKFAINKQNPTVIINVQANISEAAYTDDV